MSWEKFEEEKNTTYFMVFQILNISIYNKWNKYQNIKCYYIMFANSAVSLELSRKFW